MRSRRRRTAAAPPPNVVSSKTGDYSSSIVKQQQNCYEGERLASLLKSMEREIESARVSETGGVIPEKLWLKQQFSIGVNEVTRVLERMSPISQTPTELEYSPPSTTSHNISSGLQSAMADKAFSARLGLFKGCPHHLCQR